MLLTNRQLTESLRMQKFEDIYSRYQKRILNCEGAADLLGCSLRHFKRLRNRYEEEGGIKNLKDRRVGKASSKRAEDWEVELVTKLYNERYKDFSVKHFHEFLQQKHAIHKSYTWTKNVLTTKELIKPCKRGGPHRLRRPRKPMSGMMIHQDGSTHEWIAGQVWDLIVTMDDATSEIYSAFFIEQEGTESSFMGVKEVLTKRGLFCSFYSDRGSHYFTTPIAGGKVDKANLTQFGRSLKQLGIKHVAAYSPQARGRSERMFSTLQGRLPNELALEGITTMISANAYLKDIYLPKHNKNFMVKSESEKSAFMPFIGIDIKNILCIQEERTVQNDNTVRYEGKVLQIKSNEYRYHFVKETVKVHKYSDGTMAVFFGLMCIGQYDASGKSLLNEKQENKIAA